MQLHIYLIRDNSSEPIYIYADDKYFITSRVYTCRKIDKSYRKQFILFAGCFLVGTRQACTPCFGTQQRQKYTTKICFPVVITPSGGLQFIYFVAVPLIELLGGLLLQYCMDSDAQRSSNAKRRNPDLASKMRSSAPTTGQKSPAGNADGEGSGSARFRSWDSQRAGVGAGEGKKEFPTV